MEEGCRNQARESGANFFIVPVLPSRLAACRGAIDRADVPERYDTTVLVQTDVIAAEIAEDGVSSLLGLNEKEIAMAMVTLTADVENGAAWERSYRTHGDLFEAAGLGTIHYTVGDNNHVVMCTDVDDVKAYMDFVGSKPTQDAMKNDGVKRDTVKVFVLDKRFPS